MGYCGLIQGAYCCPDSLVTTPQLSRHPPKSQSRKGLCAGVTGDYVGDSKCMCSSKVYAENHLPQIIFNFFFFVACENHCIFMIPSFRKIVVHMHHHDRFEHPVRYLQQCTEVRD